MNNNMINDTIAEWKKGNISMMDMMNIAKHAKEEKLIDQMEIVHKPYREKIDKIQKKNKSKTSKINLYILIGGIIIVIVYTFKKYV